MITMYSYLQCVALLCPFLSGVYTCKWRSAVRAVYKYMRVYYKMK